MFGKVRAELPRSLSSVKIPTVGSNKSALVSLEASLSDEFVAAFREEMEAWKRTNKAKGVFYPETVTGKDIVAYLRKNVKGCETGRKAVMLASKMVEKNILVLHTKTVEDTTKCVVSFFGVTATPNDETEK